MEELKNSINCRKKYTQMDDTKVCTQEIKPNQPKK